MNRSAFLSIEQKAESRPDAKNGLMERRNSLWPQLVTLEVAVVSAFRVHDKWLGWWFLNPELSLNQLLNDEYEFTRSS